MASSGRLFLGLLAILLLDGGSDAARILGIFPMAGKSHFMMGEALLRELAARGHQVDVISHFPLDDPPANYRDISLAGTLPGIVNNLTLKGAEVLAGENGDLFTLNNRIEQNICETLGTPMVRSIIEKPPTDPPYDVAIVEVFSADCYLAFGRHLKVPVVGMVTSQLYDWINAPMGNPLNAAYVPSCFSKFSQKMNFYERLQNVLISTHLLAQYWYSAPVQLVSVEKYLNFKLPSIRDLYKDIALVLVNTHTSFDGARPMTPGVVEVGGLHVNDGHQDLSLAAKQWLDNSTNGCVYFSFGSMVKIESFPIETIEALYETFERISPVRVLMKIANANELPDGLPKNVMTAPWLPQVRVLKHKNIKAFVTHGGLMSTQEAITYGVPMVGIPIFADQYHNVRLSLEHNIMVSLDYQQITAESLTKALKTVIHDPTYRNNARRLSKLFTDRPISAMDTAIFWVEYVVRNGNVMRPPTDELSWWQLALLDVYAVLIVIALVVAYIVKFLIVIACSALVAKLSQRRDSKCHRVTSTSKKIK